MKTLKDPCIVVISEKISGLPDGYPDIVFRLEPDLWQTPLENDQILRVADGLIVRNQTVVDQALLRAALKLRVVGRLGAGLDNIDLQAARTAGVRVVYAPGENSIAVAEYCLGQIFNILRGLPDAIHAVSKGMWQRSLYTGRELSEVVVGLVGFGRIARLLGERLQLLGGRVIVSELIPEIVPGNFELVPFDQLLRQADIVSLHIPGGSGTYHLLGREQFKAMKGTAWLLNAARGSIVDERALCAALENGEIAGAVLDVRETEPPVNGVLESLPNLYATPHIAAFTHAAQKRVEQVVFSDVAAVLKREEPRFPADL